MISIHPPPLSSSSPLPRALHPKARCLDWRARLSSVERRWASSLWCGMGWGWRAQICQLHLGPDPTMGFRCVFPGARGNITRGQPCLPRGCCCLFGLGGWSVGSWSPDRERTHNPASQAPSEVERAKQGLTQGEVAPLSAGNRPPLLCPAAETFSLGLTPLFPRGSIFTTVV